MNLFHGDCLEVMAGLPDASVDMILCDLPYGTTACKWDSVIPFEPLWAQYRRIAKRNAAIVLTATQPFASALVMSNVKAFRHQWVWDRVGKVSGHMNANRAPMRRHEIVLVFGEAAPNYFPVKTDAPFRKASPSKPAESIYGSTPVKTPWASDKRFPVDVLAIRADDARCRLHPTQKPVALMEYMIRTYTNEGDTVLDNCMGSGTTGVACANTGRRFIGIERDDKYFAIASERIKAVQRLELVA